MIILRYKVKGIQNIFHLNSLASNSGAVKIGHENFPFQGIPWPHTYTHKIPVFSTIKSGPRYAISNFGRILPRCIESLKHPLQNPRNLPLFFT